jgi:Putative Actinobacterial Holin-X, holin superfamily III
MGVRERITTSLTDIRTRGQKLVELNVELLKAELKKKAQEYGGAIGMLVAAGLLSLYALGFLLATIAVVLALWLPTWLALLIVTLVLFLVVAILVLVGRSRLRKLQAAPPPQAPAEAKITIATMKDGASKTAKSLRPTKPLSPAGPEVAEMPAPAVDDSPAAVTSRPDVTPPPAAPPADAPPAQGPPDVPPTEVPPPEARS